VNLLLDQNLFPRRGNCSTDEIEGILRNRRAEILAFAEDPETAFPALS